MKLRNRTSEKQEPLTGTLENWPLADMLWWLHQTRRSAVVTVGFGFVSGTIHVKQGNLFRCEWGVSQGELALGALLTMTRGAFSIASLDEPCPVSNIFGRTEDVISRWTLYPSNLGRAPAAA